MLHEYYKMSIEDHRLVSPRLGLPRPAKQGADIGKAPNVTLKLRPGDFDEVTAGEDMIYNSTIDALLKEPVTVAAEPKTISDPPGKAMGSRSSVVAEISIQSPQSLGNPETTVLDKRISKLEKLIKQEPTLARGIEESSVYEKPRDDEDSENEGDETEPELSDDDDGAHDEFKEDVDAVIQGFSSPYNPLSETTPNLPAYHPSFHNVERLCVELLGDVAQVLKNSEYKDAKLADFYEQAIAKQTITYPRARRVGLVGDSGVGKVFEILLGALALLKAF